MNALTHIAADTSERIGFNYALLDPATAAAVQDTAQRIRAMVARLYVDIGHELIQVKDALPHGRFTAWAQAELGMTQRTAENYMQVARFLDGKPETVSFLRPSVLYALAARSAPAEVVQRVLNDAAAGVPLNARAIAAELDRARSEQAELKRAQRRSPNLTAAELRSRKEQQCKRDAAERARRDADVKRESKDRHDRLAPLAQQFVALCPALAPALLPVLTHHQDREVFATLLRGLLDRAPHPMVQA